MAINDLCLPGLGGTAVKATKAQRLDAPCEKVKRDSAKLSMKVPVDSEPGEIKLENILRADENFLLIAETAS
jgi:hypothetical protein